MNQPLLSDPLTYAVDNLELVSPEVRERLAMLGRGELEVPDDDQPVPRRMGPKGLSKEAQAEIVRRRRRGEKFESLALTFGVSRTTIGNVLRRAAEDSR